MCGLYSFINETCQYRPQYAFKISMFMCPAVHINSRSLLRSSSTHEPSDPPLRVISIKFIQIYLYILDCHLMCNVIHYTCNVIKSMRTRGKRK